MFSRSAARRDFEPGDTVLAQDYQTAISLVAVGVGISIVPQSVSVSPRPGVLFRSYDGFNPGTSLSINARSGQPLAARPKFLRCRPQIRFQKRTCPGDSKKAAEPTAHENALLGEDDVVLRDC